MAVSTGYKRFVLAQLERVVPITAKHMFGGVGLYVREHFFAIIDDDRLYFKVDETNRPDYEAAGMEPFQPYDDDRVMPYYEVPIEVLENVDRLERWVENAVDVARRAQ